MSHDHLRSYKSTLFCLTFRLVYIEEAQQRKSRHGDNVASEWFWYWLGLQRMCIYIYCRKLCYSPDLFLYNWQRELKTCDCWFGFRTSNPFQGSPQIWGPGGIFLLACPKWPPWGHFTHKAEGPWPLPSKSSHWSKGRGPSKFTSHTKVKA